MKTQTKNLFLLAALITSLGLMLGGPLTAQTFTTLHSFTGGSDGNYPGGVLILTNNTLYGTSGSTNGTVFAVNTDGTGFRTLHTFNGGGAGSTLIISGNTLYGTTQNGGNSGNGVAFKLNTDGSGFAILHSFTASIFPLNSSNWTTNSDGANPSGGLSLSGNTLYGTGIFGGVSAGGTVFAVNTDGTGFTNLHSFTGGNGGANPLAGVILSGNTLYGTTDVGGSGYQGTVFAVNTESGWFTTLYSFSALPGVRRQTDTNSDGAEPWAGLILSDNTLYGTTVLGGSSGYGTVFAVNTDGSGFTTLHSFTGGSDGAWCQARLILSVNTLYGTASNGGSSGNGTVFAVNTDGTGFKILYSFSAGSTNSSGIYTNSDGAIPQAGLISSGNALYGTATSGGPFGNGTVFSISFPPQLTLIPSGPNAILTWPTHYLSFDYTGYTLQSTTNLGSSAVWNAVSPSPVVIGRQQVVVNPISGIQQFFRLSQ